MRTFLKFVHGALLALLLTTQACAEDAPATFYIIAPVGKPTGLDEIVRVHINGDKSFTCKDLSLVLGDYTGLSTDCLALPGRDVIFTLGRSEANRAAWRQVIGAPFSGNRITGQPVSVSMGQTALTWQASPDVADVKVNIQRYSMGWLISTITVVLLVFVILAYKGVKSTMFRDPGIAQFSAKDCPFSLGRLQMFWWFFLTVFAFAFVFSITGTTDALNAESLALMGISGATALGAIAIDSTKAEMQEIEQKVKALGLADSQAVANLEAKAKAIATAKAKAIATAKAEAEAKGKAKSESESDAKTRAAATAEAIAIADEKVGWTEFPYDKSLFQGEPTYLQLKAEYDRLAAPIRAQGFWHDILTDVRGATLHRVQLLIWTVVLGIVFLFKTYLTMETPLFGTTLLGLMGISGGLYLGFKLPEQQAPKSTTK